MLIKKRSFLFFILMILPYALYAWGDGDKLSDGSCKFDIETGYIGSSLYLKDNESFLIVDGGDSRYGTISTVYNALTCEKVTSGDKTESDFSGVMERKGFIQTNLESNKNIDKSFQHKITFLENSDEIIVHIEPIESSVTQELKTILASISDKSASSQITISDSAREFLHYSSFYNLIFEKMDNLPNSEINYAYTLALVDKLKLENIGVNRVRNNLLAKQEELKQKIARLEEEANNKMFNTEVKSINDVPNWMSKMAQLGKQDKISKFIPKIMKLSDFGKRLTPSNFFASIEYKYILKNLKLNKVYKIENYDEEYGIGLDYPNKTIRLTKKPTCTSTGKTSEEDFACGWFWMDTCVGTYKHYKCKGNTSKIANIERKLLGTTKVATTLNKGWTYRHRIARRKKDSPSSASSGLRENQCYKISEYAPRNVCLKGTRGDACYGLENYALRKVCLEGTGGNACYAFKDYAKRKICLEGIRTDACYAISDNYNKQKSCREFSGDTDVWLIISSYGYYTIKF